MTIGCPKEIKKHEYRVGMTPSDAAEYIKTGSRVLIEKNAGADAGFEDDEYIEAGAEIIEDKKMLFDSSDMIVKVKEPLPEEYSLFHEGQILYTYLHLAASRDLTAVLLEAGVNSIAYETIEVNGKLPCLAPMSEIAGRLSVQEGAKYLEKTFGGRGILLSGVPGVERGRVAILGGGVVGANAARIAVGMGADTTLLDISGERLAYLDDVFGSGLKTLYSTRANIRKVLSESDVVIGAVLRPGAKAPWLIRRDDLKLMKKGAVIVDVAVDQGGCAETTHPTTHDDPVFDVDGIVHYCVANMPGSVALTATMALTSTTLKYGLMIASKGLEGALMESVPLQMGLNTYKGELACEGVAEAFEMNYKPAVELIG